MSNIRAREILYDSETALRLVDQELNELRDPAPSPAENEGAGLLDILQQAHTEITTLLDALKQSRHTLRDISMTDLQHSHTKIQEVSSATEVAATDIMDRLDRAQELLDQLDTLDRGESTEASVVRTQLRDELFAMMGPLQFQDITTQQLTHVSTLIHSIEARLLTIASLLDDAHPGSAHSGMAIVMAAPASVAGTYAESASVHDSMGRQAAADALFGRSRARTDVASK
jgi:chemotaxis regulatin CheY-phosphate phosphatase CheZ